jgi:SAM-dependent methyltransferase
MSDDTTSDAYAQRLQRLGGMRWKQLLDVQRPYRWNLRRLGLGRTLDVGCGLGRHLETHGPGSMGVDHKATSVQIARSRGLDAITTDEFDARHPMPPAEPIFDSLLLAHVLEHMSHDEGIRVLERYLPFVRRTVAVICPQERGYRSDSTHVTFLDGHDIVQMLEHVGLRTRSVRSFPLPRFAGRSFTHNETVVLADRP